MKRIIAAFLIALTLLTIPASAKGLSGRIRDDQGNLYLVKHGRIQYGLTRYNGNLYYGYRTSSRWNKRGMLARDCHKIVDGRWYYFTHSGKVLKHDTEYLDIRSRDSTVRYIYIPGTGHRQRYSTRLRRYQIKRHGKWYEVGMQCDFDTEKQR